jgi:hypothetical protein
MEIRLNNNDIHAAIRGYLQERNIVDSETNIDINIIATRGANPGASAEVTILEPNADMTEVSSAPEKAVKGALFNNEDD